MSTERDTTRIVRSWLEEGVTVLPDRVLDTVLHQLPATPQRRAWWPARRSLPMIKNVTRFATVAAGLAVAAALVSFSVLPGSESSETAATPTPSGTPGPTAMPTASIPFVGPEYGGGGADVEPGTYRMRGPGEMRGRGGTEVPLGWPRTVLVTVPDGPWHAVSVSSGGGLIRPEADPVASLDFDSVGDIVADPCAPGHPRGSPLGPSVDDLVAGLRSLPVLEFSEPVDVTLDGWHGKRVELTHPAGCGDIVPLWLTPPLAGETFAITSREGWRSTLWILDVDGLRFVVIASYDADAPADVRLQLEQMVDSINIEP